MSQAENTLVNTPTAQETGSIIRFPVEVATGGFAAKLSRDYADLREQVTDLGVDVVQGHFRALLAEWNELTSRKSQKNATGLLEELADDRGLSWTAIAKMIGVSVQALRKWRQGDSISGENRSKLAGLAAFMDMLELQASIGDPAGWLEVPISSGIPVRPVDSYGETTLPLLLEFACNRLSPNTLLDALDPQWRTKYEQSRWEVFEAEDGELSIRAKD